MCVCVCVDAHTCVSGSNNYNSRDSDNCPPLPPAKTG